jgi:hypothetical protein
MSIFGGTSLPFLAIERLPSRGFANTEIDTADETGTLRSEFLRPATTTRAGPCCNSIEHSALGVRGELPSC